MCDVKVLIDYESMGNYIRDSLVLALGMEVVPEKDFKDFFYIRDGKQKHYEGPRICILLIGQLGVQL